MFRFWNQIIAPLLDILQPKDVLHVGGGSGKTARGLAEYARKAGAKYTIIDPFPLFDLAAFRRRWSDVLTFHRAWSCDALPLCVPPDFVIIDGDHNWYTVLQELTSIDALAKASGKFPVVLVHDVGWPYARRDAYVLPGMIPEECRQPFTAGGVMPGTDLLLQEGGFNQRIYHAVKSGGPRNGVLTALEDFLKQTPRKLTVTFVEGFYGLAIIVPTERLEADEQLRTLLSSFTLSSAARTHLETLEESRILHHITATDLRSSVQTMRSQRDWYKKLIDDLSHKSHMKDVEMLRREKTLSWRLTAPLRQAGAIVRSFGTKSLLKAAKSYWVTCGEPLSGFVRYVRHQLLGTVFPVAPSPEVLLRTQANDIQNGYGGAAPVSVIVTARNNGPFLRECLESILAQSVKPLEILYCDDGSDDDSVAIASSIRGVRVLALKHQGVVMARNAAVAATTGDLLLHIDGDDSIPPDYLALQLQALASSNGAAFAYGGSDMHGLTTGSFFQEWDVKRLWTRNFINTSSLIRRSAFEAAGGWRDVAGTLWDWDLWLRMSRIGHGVSSRASLQYRRHERSWSEIQRQLGHHDIGLLFGRIRRAVAKTSICAIVSGRLPELTDMWIDALVASIKASESAVEPPELVVLDNSTNGMEGRIRKALERHPDVFRSVLIVPYPVRFYWKSEMERRHMVSKFLATAYNRILDMADGEIVWFIEDDIVVPEHAYETLLRDLTDGENPPAAVCGLYRARHMDQFVAHRVSHDFPIAVKDEHVAPLDIDLAGTGCTMAFRPFITHPFTSHWRGRSPAHDWAWCDAIRADGYRIVLDPRVRCKHYQTLTEHV